MEIKYVIKKTVRAEHDNIPDQVWYYKNGTYDDQYTVNITFHEWKASIFRANEYNAYEFAANIIKALLEEYPYDTSVCYQVEKIFIR